MGVFVRILILWTLVSCTSNPVDQQLDQIRHLQSGHKHQTYQNEMARVWFDNYTKALELVDSNRTQSCSLFSGLALDRKFPLNKVASLRLLENCPGPHPKQVSLLAKKVDQDWLDKLKINALLVDAHRNKDVRDIMDWSFEKSKVLTDQEEKLNYTFEALKAAKRVRDKKKIETLQARVYKLAPRLIQRPKRAEYLKVAADFKKNRDFKLALRYYFKVVKYRKSSWEDKYQALRGIRSVFRLQRTSKMSEYIQATKDLAQFTERRFNNWRTRRYWTSRYHDNQVLYARTLWSYKSRNSAIRVLQRAQVKIKGKHSLAQVYWLRARMAEEAKNYNESIAWLEKAADEPRMGPNMDDEIRWHLAWNYNKMGQFKKAIEQFDESIKLTTNIFLKHKLYFWKAKVLQKDGQGDLAQKTFNELIELDPIGYYGILAYRQLDQAIPAVRSLASTNKLANLEEIIGKTDLVTLEWLIAVKEKDLSRKFLDSLSERKLVSNTKNSTEVWTQFLKYYARAGDYLGLFMQLGNIDSELRDQIFQKNPQLLFPEPFKDHVTEAAEHFEVNPNLIYSIMRQESAFNPKARSHADAFGLMQLIPEMAKRAARYANIRFQRHRELYDPETNIMLGSAFLKNLLGKNNNNFLVTVASYNASEKAIKNWVQTRYTGDPLEFIEDIPYSETQGYIKLVLRNLVFYQRLNSDGEAIYFPEWCLQSLQDFKS